MTGLKLRWQKRPIPPKRGGKIAEWFTVYPEFRLGEDPGGNHTAAIVRSLVGRTIGVYHQPPPRPHIRPEDLNDSIRSHAKMTFGRRYMLAFPPKWNGERGP